MHKLIAYLSTAIALTLAIGIVAYFRYYGNGGGFLHRDLDAAAVVKEVRDLNELVTVRYVMQKVVGITEEHQPLGHESLLLMVQGKVLAGVDLRTFNQYDVESLRNHTATIRLPAPHIVDVFIDEKNTRVWDRSITWWTPWVAPDRDLEHKARLLGIDEIKNAALENGILNDAKRSAQEAVRRFLANFGVAVVRFQDDKSTS